MNEKIPNEPHKAVLRTAVAATVLIAVGAFVLSFDALTDLARRSGINANLAWIWPIIVDGMIVASTVAIVALNGHSRRAMIYPWSLLFFGAIVSTAANSVARDPHRQRPALGHPAGGFGAASRPCRRWSCWPSPT